MCVMPLDDLSQILTMVNPKSALLVSPFITVKKRTTPRLKPFTNILNMAVEKLKQGCKYLAYKEPKWARDEDSSIIDVPTPLWVVQVHKDYYLVVVQFPDGHLDAFRKKAINLDARLNSGQIELESSGHFESCKIEL